MCKQNKHNTWLASSYVFEAPKHSSGVAHSLTPGHSFHQHFCHIPQALPGPTRAREGSSSSKAGGHTRSATGGAGGGRNKSRLSTALGSPKGERIVPLSTYRVPLLQSFHCYWLFGFSFFKKNSAELKCNHRIKRFIYKAPTADLMKATGSSLARFCYATETVHLPRLFGSSCPATHDDI